jgi:HSP20 family protein
MKIIRKKEGKMRTRSLVPFGNKGRELGYIRDPFTFLRKEMNSLFDRSLGDPPSNILDSEAIKVDVRDDEKALVITAEIPGVCEKDISVNLNQDILFIQGEKKFEKKEEQSNYFVMERGYGIFSRSLQLPFLVDPEKVEAELSNGVLTLTIPKPKENIEKIKKIDIKKK